MTPLIPFAESDLSVAEVSHGNAIIVSGRQMLGTIIGTGLLAVAAQISGGKQTTAAGINAAYAILMGIALMMLKNRKPKAEV